MIDCLKFMWLSLKDKFCNKQDINLKFKTTNISETHYKELANKIAVQVIKNKGTGVVAIDPMIIILIIRIIWMIVSCYLKYKFTKSHALRKVKRPGLFDRLFLKRITRNTVEDFKKKIVFGANIPILSDEIYKQILVVGKDLTENDIEKLVIQHIEVKGLIGE